MISQYYESKKWIAFLILAKIARPSETAPTMVAKLSSVDIMSAAPLATSVPVFPLKFRYLRLIDGASLTPSPVL